MLGDNLKLSARSQRYLQVILEDPEIVKLLVVDEGRRVAQRVTIEDNGNVVFGYTKMKLVNQIFNLQEHFSFTDLCRGLTRIFAQGVNNSNSKEKEARILLGLSADIVNDVFLNEDADAATESLMFTYMLRYSKGKSHSENKQKQNGNQPPCHNNNGKNGGKQLTKEVIVEVVKEVEVPVPVKDSDIVMVSVNDTLKGVAFDREKGGFIHKR